MAEAEQLVFPDIEKEVRDAVDAAIQNGIDELVQQALQEQSWYRKYANTINTAVGIASTAAATVLSLGLNLPPAVSAALAGVGSLATILGVYRTTNGIQPSTAEQLRATK